MLKLQRNNISKLTDGAFWGLSRMHVLYVWAGFGWGLALLGLPGLACGLFASYVRLFIQAPAPKDHLDSAGASPLPFGTSAGPNSLSLGTLPNLRVFSWQVWKTSWDWGCLVG